ncbi:MAG: hypothetical protein V1885_02925 [Candidatus Brennerbacteria bacterium]
MRRKTIAILVLAGGLVGAFSITRLAATSVSSNEALTISAGGGNGSAFAYGESGSALQGFLGEGADTNLTELVAQRYGEEILKLNQPGSDARAIALPPEGTVESIIAKVVEIPLIFKTYTVQDLRTAPLKDKEELARYFVALAQIQAERFRNVNEFLLTAVAKFVSEGDETPLRLHRNAMAAYAGDLLTITVPSPLVPFHLGLMNLWQKRATIASHILQSGEDPLKVVAAVDSLSITADEEDALMVTLVANLKSANL